MKCFMEIYNKMAPVQIDWRALWSAKGYSPIFTLLSCPCLWSGLKYRLFLFTL